MSGTKSIEFPQKGVKRHYNIGSRVRKLFFIDALKKTNQGKLYNHDDEIGCYHSEILIKHGSIIACKQ